MTLRVVHVPAEGCSSTGPWELINGYLFAPGSYARLWRGERPEAFSVIRLKCLLDASPKFPWAEHPSSGSWSSACEHRPRSGMTVVPVAPCVFCMLDAGADGLLAELAASYPPSSMNVRMIEVQASELAAKNETNGYAVCAIQPSAPKPHPKSPSWLTPQWEAPDVQDEPPTKGEGNGWMLRRGEPACLACGGPANAGYGLLPSGMTPAQLEAERSRPKRCYGCTVRSPDPIKPGEQPGWEHVFNSPAVQALNPGPGSVPPPKVFTPGKQRF